MARRLSDSRIAAISGLPIETAAAAGSGAGEEPHSTLNVCHRVKCHVFLVQGTLTSQEDTLNRTEPKAEKPGTRKLLLLLELPAVAAHY